MPGGQGSGKKTKRGTEKVRNDPASRRVRLKVKKNPAAESVM